MPNLTELIKKCVFNNQNSQENLIEKVALSDGQILFNQGDIGDAFYFIKKGQLKIFILDAEGQSITLNILSSGDTLGELALLDAEPRSASAIAIDDCLLLRIHKDKFLEQLHKYPQLMKEMIPTLSRIIRYKTEYIMKLGQWSRLIIDSQYKTVLTEIESTNIEDSKTSSAVLAVGDSLKEMVKVIFEREEYFKQEFKRLKFQISINQKQKEEDVKQITDSETFEHVIKNAERLKKLRKK
jgi:CRP-like cAMP-binding protein